MPKWYKTKEFLEMRRAWYDQLAEEGFKDTETFDWETGETMHLTPSHVVTTDKILKGYGPSWDLVRDFYTAARRHTHLLEQEDHPKELVEAWRLFADEGLKFRELSRRTGIYRKRLTDWIKAQAARFWHLGVPHTKPMAQINAGRPPAPETDPTLASPGTNTLSSAANAVGPRANNMYLSVSG